MTDLYAVDPYAADEDNAPEEEAASEDNDNYTLLYYSWGIFHIWMAALGLYITTSTDQYWRNYGWLTLFSEIIVSIIWLSNTAFGNNGNSYHKLFKYSIDLDKIILGVESIFYFVAVLINKSQSINKDSVYHIFLFSSGILEVILLIFFKKTFDNFYQAQVDKNDAAKAVNPEGD